MSLPSISATTGGQRSMAGRGSASTRKPAGGPRARSAMSQHDQEDELEGYRSFALFCEVKLQEVRRSVDSSGAGGGRQRDRRVVDLCFSLLHKVSHGLQLQSLWIIPTAAAS